MDSNWSAGARGPKLAMKRDERQRRIAVQVLCLELDSGQTHAKKIAGHRRG
jgi:hypothetical protein